MTFSNVISLVALKLLPNRSSPLMVSERNVQSLQLANSPKRHRATLWLARRLYRRADGALAISHPVAGELVSAFHLSPRSIFVVPNPVITSTDPPNEADLDLPSTLHLVLVGRMTAQKRPELFLSVVSALADRGIVVRGTAIGDGPLRQAAERECTRLGLNVAFLGWQEPWWEAVSDVDCLVLTANAEGFANVLVEAAAAGIPSVAPSRALGVADAIVPGISGELAMDDTPQALADAVIRAARLAGTTTPNISRWLLRFSSTNSTDSLLAALDSITKAQPVPG
jgi:glycosyltransferase involved in cell wall biosynthesis